LCVFSCASFPTSSRSTKINGGVRYLEQGDISMVKEALKERGLMAQNAAHLVKTNHL
jgi:glycerol-3-phosphate dehydrogenase